MIIRSLGPNERLSTSWEQRNPARPWIKAKTIWTNFLQHSKDFLSVLVAKAPSEKKFSWKAKVLDKADKLHSVILRWMESNHSIMFSTRTGVVSLASLEGAPSQELLDTVCFLLSNGWRLGEHSANKTISSRQFQNATIYAAGRGDLENLQFLCFKDSLVFNLQSPLRGRHLGVPSLNTAITAAARNGHLEIVRFLLPLYYKNHISQDHLGQTLSEAGFGGHLEIVQLLLSRGRTLDERSRHSLILSSAFLGATPFLEILLQRGPILEFIRDSAITNAGRSLHNPSPQLISTIRNILRRTPIIPDTEADRMYRAQVDIPAGSFVTTLDNVNSNPEAHLKTIYEGGFPLRVILSDNPRTVDLGGVTKQFISTLMKALRPKLALTEAGLPQNERADASYPRYKTLYMQLGRFYALMDTKNEDRTDKFVTGALLHPRFFTIVKIIATESSLENRRRKVAEEVLATNPESIASQLFLRREITAEMLQTYRDGIGCNEGEELQAAQTEIDSVIEAAQNFYDGATESFQRKIRNSDPTLLARSLHGEPASKEALLAAIEKDSGLPEERFRWIQEKIQTSDEPWRIRFVKAITGNEVLSPGVRIQIGVCWRGPGVFELHSCSNSLDVPMEAVPEGLRRSIAEEVLAADPANTDALLVLGRAVTPEALQGYRNAKGCAQGQELEAAKKEIDHRQFMAALDAILVGEGYNIA